MSMSEQIIEIVKNYPILYDTSHPEYKDKQKKNETMEEIGQFLGVDGKLSFKSLISLLHIYNKKS